MSATRTTAVVLDPMDDVADTTTRIEDWLLFAEPDTAEADVTVRAGARAGGVVAVALTHAAGAAPAYLWSRLRPAVIASTRRDQSALSPGELHRQVLPRYDAPMAKAHDLDPPCWL